MDRMDFYLQALDAYDKGRIGARELLSIGMETRLYLREERLKARKIIEGVKELREQIRQSRL